MDRCDQLRQSALAFAVKHFGAAGNQVAIEQVVGTAKAFHKFLLGGHESLTEKEVVEMEAVIREDEANPPSRTYSGDNVVTLDGPQRAEGGA